MALGRSCLWFLSVGLACAFQSTPSLLSSHSPARTRLHMSAVASRIPSWPDLQASVAQTPVGQALDLEATRRRSGTGAPHVHNPLRMFGGDGDKPNLILYRDHAGWCPYCQKTMLLIEEKNIPIQIELVNMRSYGDKPREFLQKVPGGLLPALELVETGQIITESQVIMELLDEWHADQGPWMVPTTSEGQARYRQLATLERQLFSCWCNWMFRPDMPSLSTNTLSKLLGGGSKTATSAGQEAFFDCMGRVDQQLQSTAGPWFFDADHPTMIDFIFVSHVERMLASAAYWKGVDLRGDGTTFPGLVRWLEAFEKREAYLAFKSDYFTHVMDIPPQYGPSYEGGDETQRNKNKLQIRTVLNSL